jgi:hypothetical protein
MGIKFHWLSWTDPDFSPGFEILACFTKLSDTDFNHHLTLNDNFDINIYNSNTDLLYKIWCSLSLLKWKTDVRFWYRRAADIETDERFWYCKSADIGKRWQILILKVSWHWKVMSDFDIEGQRHWKLMLEILDWFQN